MRAGAAFVRLPTLEPGNQSDVLFHVQMREKSDFLNHVPSSAPQLNGIPVRGLPSLNHDLTLIRVDEAVYHLEAGRLPRPARSQQHQRLSLLDAE